MPAPPTRLRAHCSQCGREDDLSEPELVSRLRGLGMLKREDERDLHFLLQLARAAGSRWTCPACGSGGVSIEVATHEDDWDATGKACAACGAAIPSERLELFPDSELCATCQERVEQGQSPDGHDDFCPRCGSRMVVRQRRGAGIAAYEMVCPDCRR